MPNTLNYDAEQFNLLYQEAQDDFDRGLTSQPGFTEPRFTRLYQDILSHIESVAKSLYRKMCLADQAIEQDDIQSTLYMDWHMREYGEWFSHRKTGQRYRKAKYQPGSPMTFRNWLFIEGRAVVQSHLEENGHSRPINVDGNGTKHRGQNPVLHTISFSRLNGNGRSPDKPMLSLDNVEQKGANFQPEDRLMEKSLLHDANRIIEGMDNLSPCHREFLRQHILGKESLRSCKEFLKLPEVESKLKNMADSKRRILRQRLRLMGYDKGIL